MSTSVDFRPALAAAAVLAVLAGAYEYAAQTTRGSALATPITASAEPVVSPAPPVPTIVETKPEPVLPDPAPDCHPQPIRFERYRLVPKPGPRRYRGTVGGELATAELSWSHPDSVTGSFYLWRRGPEYQLRYYGRRQGPLLLSLSHEYPDSRSQDGTWHLTAPLGSVLQGVWVDSAGQRRAFVLRESYTEGVQYELQSLTLTGGKPESGGVEGFACAVPSYTQEYLHLLAPAAQRPALRHLQAAPLAVRRRQMRKAYDLSATSFYGVEVRLNDFQLLSYATYYEAMPFGGQRQNEVTGTLLDLRTGQQLPLASQLVANYRPKLRYLIAQHLLHDANFDFVNKDQDYRWLWQEATSSAPDTTYSTSLWTQRELAPLTDQTVLTSEGLELTYWLGGLSNAGSTMPDQTVLVPYRELRPLVRPGTPLARMLKARGMW